MNFSQAPILKDFDLFLDYLAENPVLELTKDKGLLRGKDLLCLHEKMICKSFLITNKSKQMAFVVLNTFFFLAEAASFFTIKRNPKTKKKELHLNIENAKLYDTLSEDEKYFFFLEGIWCFMDWEAAFDVRFFMVSSFYLELVKYPAGKRVTIEERTFKREGVLRNTYAHFLVEAFAALGLLEIVWDDAIEKRKSYSEAYYKELTLTDLGNKVLPTLFEKRERGIWSVFNEMFYFEEEEIGDIEKENFEDAFLTHFPHLKITNRIFTSENTEIEMVSGKYEIKVSYDTNVYRTIVLASTHTFENLHLAIQDAYDFDDDHAYVFFLDGKRWSKSRAALWSPNCQDDPFAYEILIGEAGLYEGQEFLYIFDFGYEWTFTITVENIDTTAKEPKETAIIKSVGEGPTQYDYEDEDEDEEY